MFIDDEDGTDDALLTHQTLIDTQERLGALLDLMPTGLIIHQQQGVLYANQQAQFLLNQSQEALIGQHILDFIQDDAVRTACTEMFMGSFQDDAPKRFPQVTLRTHSDTTRYVQLTAGRLPWEGTSVVQILMEDITELKLQADKLEELTFKDPLTGAYNRRYFIEQAEKFVTSSIQENQAFGLLVFDVDWFKKVNDTYGHLAGDEALKRVVSVWTENTRQSADGQRNKDGTLARIGGEEFAIFLPEADMGSTRAVAERIRSSLEKEIIQFEEQSFSITASFGLTTLREGDNKLDDLIRRADIALYRAKELGRNRVECE